LPACSCRPSRPCRVIGSPIVPPRRRFAPAAS
jgi:hypothetical protein